MLLFMVKTFSCSLWQPWPDFCLSAYNLFFFLVLTMHSNTQRSSGRYRQGWADGESLCMPITYTRTWKDDRVSTWKAGHKQWTSNIQQFKQYIQKKPWKSDNRSLFHQRK